MQFLSFFSVRIEVAKSCRKTVGIPLCMPLLVLVLAHQVYRLNVLVSTYRASASFARSSMSSIHPPQEFVGTKLSFYLMVRIRLFFSKGQKQGPESRGGLRSLQPPTLHLECLTKPRYASLKWILDICRPERPPSELSLSLRLALSSAKAAHLATSSASSHSAGPCFVRQTLRSASRSRYGCVVGRWHLLRVEYGEEG